ncbi:MAG: serine protease, partial [Cypionkella sp.]
GDETTLAGLYDALQSLEAVPAAGERGLDGASFVINGADDRQAAFATARASKGTIKGFMLIWPFAQTEAAQRALGIMRASFRSTGDQVLDPGLVPLDETVRAGVIAGMEVKQPKSRISGTFVDMSGLVLTAAEGVSDCGRITLDSATDAEVIASDAALGAAILRPLSPVSPMAVARLATASAPVGTKVLLAGYSLPSGLPAPVLTRAEITSLTGPSGEAGLITLSANVTPHDLGGPVLDEAGALMAMVRGTQAQGKTLPQGTALGLPAASFAPLLAGAGAVDLQGGAAMGSAAPSPDALNATAMGMTVQVACWP